jgi:hypothetical protein
MFEAGDIKKLSSKTFKLHLHDYLEHQWNSKISQCQWTHPRSKLSLVLN